MLLMNGNLLFRSEKDFTHLLMVFVVISNVIGYIFIRKIN